MKTRFLSFLAVLALLVSLTASPVLADRELMEGDEQDGTNPPLGQIYGLVLPESPLHVGDTATGGNDWPAINGQYNEPRNYARWWQHAGVDIESGWSGRQGRPVWASYPGTVKNKWNSNGAYGNSIETEHYYRVDGMTYRWRFFHAHFYSHNTALAVGNSVDRQTLLGYSGDTGLGCITACVHVHLELRPVSSLNSAGGTRALAPNLMFNSQTSNWSGGLDATFLTRVSAPLNSVAFRLTTKSNLVMPNPAYTNVAFWYKNSSGTWVKTTNWTNIDPSTSTFTMDLKTIKSTGTVEFYVAADNAAYDGIYRGPAYRPFRHGYNQSPDSNPGSAPPPQDRPMTYTLY